LIEAGTLNVLVDPETSWPRVVSVHGWPGVLIAAVEDSGNLAEAVESSNLEVSVCVSYPMAEFLDLIPVVRACGVLVIDQKFGWRASTRLEEANNDRPTALVWTDIHGSVEPGLATVVRRNSTAEMPVRDFIPWRRWDIIDPGWLNYLDEDEPILGWQDGQPLYGIRVGSESLYLIGEDPVFGPWVSSDGTVVIAQSPGTLMRFANSYEGQVRFLGTPGDDAEMTANIFEILDFPSWKAGLPDNPPFGMILNPGLPRGYVAVLPPHSNQFISVSGTFRIGSNNVIESFAHADTWPQYSTLRYAVGPDVDLLPLDRSFAVNPLSDHSSRFIGATIDEIDETLSELLDQPATSDIYQLEDDEISDAFSIIYWDTILGFGGVETFPSLVAAISWLVDLEREHDREARTSGVSHCWAMGTHGSGDFLGEGLTGSLIRKALQRWLSRVIERGYRPSDADALTRLVNATFSTIHVTAAGFLGDLIWRLNSSEESLETLTELDGAPIDTDQANRWIDGRTLSPDAQSAAVIEGLMGAVVWMSLEDRSRFFLATAQADFESRGASPVLDYAPVNLSIIKSLEVELGALITSYRDSITESATVTPQAHHERVFQNFLKEGGPKPSIGEFRHLFSKSDNPDINGLQEYIKERGGEKLLSNNFRKALTKVTEIYRNGGVHESAISLDNCRKCQRDLIGDTDSAGMISLVSSWKRAESV
jgi:hypothetical protein